MWCDVKNRILNSSEKTWDSHFHSARRGERSSSSARNHRAALTKFKKRELDCDLCIKKRSEREKTRRHCLRTRRAAAKYFFSYIPCCSLLLAVGCFEPVFRREASVDLRNVPRFSSLLFSTAVRCLLRVILFFFLDFSHYTYGLEKVRSDGDHEPIKLTNRARDKSLKVLR